MLIRFSVENFKSFNDRQELVLRFTKHVITKKIPMEASKMYCRVFSENQEKESKFEFEIYKNGKFYAYGFSLLMSEQIINSEWLYELLPSKNTQTMLFERETAINRLELGENLILDEIDTMRFKTYKLDFEDNDTGISKVKIEEISVADLKSKIPTKIADDILQSFKTKLEDSADHMKAMMSLRTNTAFYNIKGAKGEEPVITTIMLEHGNAYGDFEFSEESEGTRRLFDLLDILISNEKNKIYVIDELERSLHPKLTYKFLELDWGQEKILKA